MNVCGSFNLDWSETLPLKHSSEHQTTPSLCVASNDPRICLYHEPPPLASEPTWLAYDNNLNKQSIVSMLWAQKQGNKALLRDDGGQLSHRGNFWPVARRPRHLGMRSKLQEVGQCRDIFPDLFRGSPTAFDHLRLPYGEPKVGDTVTRKIRRKTSERKRLLNNGTIYYIHVYIYKYISS